MTDVSNYSLPVDASLGNPWLSLQSLLSDLKVLSLSSLLFPMIRDPELWKQQQYRAIELSGAQEPNSLKSSAPKSSSLSLAEARCKPSLPCSSSSTLFFFKPLIILIWLIHKATCSLGRGRDIREMHAFELFLSPRPDTGSQKLWGQPLKNHITLQQAIPKSCFSLSQVGGETLKSQELPQWKV